MYIFKNKKKKKQKELFFYITFFCHMDPLSNNQQAQS